MPRKIKNESQRFTSRIGSAITQARHRYLDQYWDTTEFSRDSPLWIVHQAAYYIHDCDLYLKTNKIGAFLKCSDDRISKMVHDFDLVVDRNFDQCVESRSVDECVDEVKKSWKERDKAVNNMSWWKDSLKRKYFDYQQMAQEDRKKQEAWDLELKKQAEKRRLEASRDELRKTRAERKGINYENLKKSLEEKKKHYEASLARKKKDEASRKQIQATFQKETKKIYGERILAEERRYNIYGRKKFFPIEEEEEE